MRKIISILIPILIPILIIIIVIIALVVVWGMSSTGGSSSFGKYVGSTIEEKLWWAMHDAGFDDIRTASLMGNIYQESKFDYKSHADNGLGLCGWLYDYLGDNLVEYAESKGEDWPGEETQIDFIIAWHARQGPAVDYVNESEGPLEGMAYEYFGVKYEAGAWLNYKLTGDTDADLDYCTMAYCANYERCGEDEIREDVRKEWAKKYYEEFHNKKRPTSSFSNGKGYWWPVGGNEIVKENGIEYAPGTPTSTDIWWEPGYRAWGGGSEWHKGTDIGHGAGTDYIISIGNGEVVKRTNRIDWGNGYNNDGAGLDGYGNACMVKYADNLYVIYGHMKANSVRVKSGDKVKRGQVLGIMGDSGSASGVHICFVLLKGETISQENTITDREKYVSATNPRP